MIIQLLKLMNSILSIRESSKPLSFLRGRSHFKKIDIIGNLTSVCVKLAIRLKTASRKDISASEGNMILSAIDLLANAVYASLDSEDVDFARITKQISDVSEKIKNR